MDDVVCVIETDKVSVDVRAPQAGKLMQVFGESDDTVEVGDALFVLDTSAEAPAGGDAKDEPASEPAPAAEKKEASSASSPPPAAAAPAPAPAAPSGERTERRVKLSRMRLRIAERLKEAQNTAACLTTFQECDMGALMDMRNQYKGTFEEQHGVKLGFMSAFVKASAAALMEVPAINAIIDDETKEIVYYDYADISVAVATPNGLMVPVLRNCESMGFADVEKTIGDFGARAREGNLALEDMAGGTFTISNGGVFGSLMGTPILNPPQSAVLGMHATKMRAVVKNGEVVARPMMYLALTYDHRLVDGREAVTFLKSIAEKIEDPQRLLLEL